MNLTPRVVVKAVGAKGFVRRQTFDADTKNHRFFEMTLPNGHYELTATGARKPISVTVKAGKRTRANFQSPGCL